VVAWERIAEIANQYLRKDSQAYVRGRLPTRQRTEQQVRNWYATEIIANDLTLLGGSSQRDGHDDRESDVSHLPRSQTRATPATETDDDVPF
jgi:single-strand DNA-binding protein